MIPIMIRVVTPAVLSLDVVEANCSVAVSVVVPPHDLVAGPALVHPTLPLLSLGWEVGQDPGHKYLPYILIVLSQGIRIHVLVDVYVFA